LLVKLISLMPATNAVSERSASALRRVKTYLRSSSALKQHDGFTRTQSFN